MRSPTMLTLENPPPSPFAVQVRGGPSVGQLFRRPVSVESPSRLGPRNWGQSSAKEEDASTSKVKVGRRERNSMRRDSEGGNDPGRGGSEYCSSARPTRINRVARLFHPDKPGGSLRLLITITASHPVYPG